MARGGAREFKRALKRLGISAELKEIPDVERVVIERAGPFDVVVENPQVAVLTIEGQTVVYVVGQLKEVEKAKEAAAEEAPFTEEDVQLVAAETGASLEEARKALIATKGDLAQAIMMLESMKKG